jgi:uncharacterized damage-inducible protein DinB
MEVARIADQLKHAFEADPWHGPALLEVLEGVNAAQAAARPLANAHSIWELVQHLTAWKRAVCVRLGGQAIELVGEKDWPPVGDTSEAAWQKTLAELKEAHKQVMRAVEELPDARLEDKVPGRDHTVYFMLHGLAQHDAYHGGQIALLKKA